jgi:hypothetical protein
MDGQAYTWLGPTSGSNDAASWQLASNWLDVRGLEGARKAPSQEDFVEYCLNDSGAKSGPAAEADEGRSNA